MKNEDGGGALKTATAVVGLLAGLIAGVYVLGAMVISLRLILFDHFSLQGAVTAVAQLPRESAIATALLNVLGLAALIGLAAAMFYGLARLPKARTLNPAPPRLEGESEADYAERSGRLADRLFAGPKLRIVLFLFFVLVSAGSALVAWAVAKSADDGVDPPILPFLFTALLTYGAVALGWYLIRRAARRPGWARAHKALAAGAVWAGIAVIPLLMLAGTKPFETAQICLNGEPAPVKGKLIGEGSDKLFLEEEFGQEASIVVLPAAEVTKREFGDLSSLFTCPLAPGQKQAVREAEADIGLHGSTDEKRLAREMRPLLRFDSGERWRPIGVDQFLAEDDKGVRGHLACWTESGAGGEGAWVHCGDPPDPAELRPRRGAPDFLEIEGTLTEPGSYEAPPGDCKRGAALDCNSGESAVVYYRRSSHAGLWYWDYWWFFRFNDYSGSFNECRFYCADHEGDWEGMTVITTPSLTAPKLVGAVYAAHKDRVLVPGELVPRRGKHALVFVARGTHASYPFACRASACEQFGSLLGFRLPEEGHDGTVSWGGNVEAACVRFECVQPLPDVRRTKQAALPLATGWAAWGGKWGSSCVRGCDRAESSPNSPGAQTRFKCPWAPNREAHLSPKGTVSRSEPAGDAERLLALCKAQRADF